ncbi:hypothetical protein [Nitrospira sp. BLG_2]|uniref:hypothetical protein n=1 Tax=Nitrospira sp. BLG_2 TaxID=3397507 RepID=UPI003B9B02ED
MAMRSLLLLVLLVGLSGCIVTYRDFPIANPFPGMSATPAPVPCHQTVQFSYGLAESESYGATWGGPYQWTYSGMLSPPGVARALHDALQLAGCSGDPLYTTWPRTEVVVKVLEKPYPWHWYGELLGRLSSSTYFVIPFYIDEGAWEFSYSVHQNMLTKTYTYDITSRQFYWVLLLPFSWMNVFTYNLEDAVRSTTAQFVADARRDGYLGRTD